MSARTPRPLAIIVGGAMAVPRLASAHPSATAHVHGTGWNLPLALILVLLLGAAAVLLFRTARAERSE